MGEVALHTLYVVCRVLRAPGVNASRPKRCLSRIYQQSSRKNQCACFGLFYFSKSYLFCINIKNGAFSPKFTFAEGRVRPFSGSNLISEIGRFDPTVKVCGSKRSCSCNTGVPYLQENAPP